MEDKSIAKSTIVDLFEHMIESGESKSIIDAIQKERGNERPIATRTELLEQRQQILKRLSGQDKKEEK